MKPYELFKLIKETEYTKSGIDVDWQVVRKDDVLYLLFQESRTKQDWKTNFNFPVRPYKNQQSTMWIHRGFAKAYKSCNDEIMAKFIREVDKGGYKGIVIAGWSYGGAMAILAAEDFHYRTGRHAKLITFGGPKVAGGIKTRNYLRSCVLSMELYAHKCDIVPKVPPFYFKLSRIKLGKWKPFGIFNAEKYHCHYDDINLY